MGVHGSNICTASTVSSVLVYLKITSQTFGDSAVSSGDMDTAPDEGTVLQQLAKLFQIN